MIKELVTRLAQAEMNRLEFCQRAAVLGGSLWLDGSWLPYFGGPNKEIPGPQIGEVKPYFKGHNPEGALVDIAGQLKGVGVLENYPDPTLNGKLVVVFSNSGQEIYVDPLAFGGREIGSHPAETMLFLILKHKLWVDPLIITALSDPEQRDGLFHRIRFNLEPSGDHQTSGIIHEVFGDGSCLVVPEEMPPDLRNPDFEPSFMRINPTAFREDQGAVFSRIGFEFDLAPFQGRTLQETVANLLDHFTLLGARQRVYYTAEFVSDILRKLGFDLGGDEVINLGSSLRVAGNETIVTTHSQQRQEGRVFRVVGDEALPIYATPGIIFLAVPLPQSNRLMVSAEGYPPEDLRFQNIFQVDLADPDQIAPVRFPLFPRLYGFDSKITGPHLFLTRYGFAQEDTRAYNPRNLPWHARVSDPILGRISPETFLDHPDEGGGLWVMDLHDPALPVQRLTSDIHHVLSCLHLPSASSTSQIQEHLELDRRQLLDFRVFLPLVFRSRQYRILLTSKRNYVDQVNVMVQASGVTKMFQDRLGTVGGWNPATIAYQSLSDGRTQVLIESTMDWWPGNYNWSQANYIYSLNV